MTEEEFDRVQIGDVLLEGTSHLVEVVKIIVSSRSIEYIENGYWHEVDYTSLFFYPRKYLGSKDYDERILREG